MKDIQVKVGILIACESNILLIKEWSNKKNGYFWNIIKGTYGDVPNESVKECAIRESFEEAGLKVRLTHLLPCAIMHDENKSQIQYNFIAKKVSGKPAPPSQAEQLTRSEDIQEVRWFSKKEIKKMKMVDFISEKSYGVVYAWMHKKIFPLSLIRENKGFDAFLRQAYQEGKRNKNLFKD